MGQAFQENIPSLVRASGTSCTMASTNNAQPTRIQIGGQSYALSASLTLSTASVGAGGLDVGSLAASQIYYVYAVVNTSTFVVALVASLSVPSAGPLMPSGYGAAYKWVGGFSTDTGPAVASVLGRETLGFPVSSANIAGRTDGVAPAAGGIGQVITATLSGISQASPTSGTYYDDPGTLPLTAGSWLIYCGLTIDLSNPGSISGAAVPIIQAALRTGSTVVQRVWISAGQVNGVTMFGAGTFISAVNISISTTYKASIGWLPNTGSPTVGSMTAYASLGYLYAVRIA